MRLAACVLGAALVLLWAFARPATASSATVSGDDAADGGSTADAGSIDITSDTMTVLTGTHQAMAHGNVHTVGRTFESDCDDGTVIYGEAQDGRRKIETMILNHHVRLHRFSDGLVAISDHAVYTAASREFVLTGDPVATRGPHVLKGTRMTVELDTDITHVVEPRAEIARANKPYPLHIRGETMVSTAGGKHVRFDRNVVMSDPNFVAHADHMEADLDNPGGSNDTSQVSHMLLSGHVTGHQQNEDGSAGRAIYEGATGNWTLLDNPVVIQDGDTVQGERIIVDGTTGRARAEKGKAIIPENQK